MSNRRVLAAAFVPAFLLAMAFACGGDDYFDEYDARTRGQSGGQSGGDAAPVGEMVTGRSGHGRDGDRHDHVLGRCAALSPGQHERRARLHAACTAGACPPTRVVVNDGKLQHVMVWVSKGLEGKRFPVRTDVVNLDQDGCIYKPHVVAVQMGQPLNITNSDPTTHNVHPLPRENREWNKSQTLRRSGDRLRIPARGDEDRGEVQHPSLDAGLRPRDGAPVLRGQRCRRNVRDRQPAPWQLHAAARCTSSWESRKWRSPSAPARARKSPSPIPADVRAPPARLGNEHQPPDHRAGCRRHRCVSRAG